MTARKKLENELTKEMIIHEAHRHFIAHDYSKVSMREIAKELGCTHGAIYYHFKNKADLFYAVVEHYFNELNLILSECVFQEGNPTEKARNVLIEFIKFGLDHQSQYNYMFMKQDEEIDPLRQNASIESLHQFTKTIQKLYNEQLPNEEIFYIFVSMHGFVSHYAGRVENFEEAREAAERFTQYLIRALEKY
ncbi:TetR/AcrR family transcriptional regulator [Lysinibacillus odysseyi]|uniref:HTH tetR-type domain-containing protein n=1 Tax=Lysinibacillus odysseyi 34hs-1 = NBRC 100172 TaxID=1220589 RepID=A0A0A3IAZ9_9BACI|nr:TetR/AcrR family transcriptional regulator [Lysinibacillus odysseyi]KGR81884.1 hypothetical protein CD32_21470 [Lysinibacillus odysseyi 34hs-1 = NBRC 100172]